VDEAEFFRARQHARLVDSAPVVGDTNQHRRAISLCRQDQCRNAWLAGLLTLRGWLDTVIERITQKVQYRLAHLVEHRAIELDLAAFDPEIDFLPQRSRGVANDSGESLEYLPDRNHTAGHYFVLQIGQNLRGAQRRLQ